MGGPFTIDVTNPDNMLVPLWNEQPPAITPIPINRLNGAPRPAWRHRTNNRLLQSTGERATVWNTAAYAEPISGHAARRSDTAAPILRSTAQRILFRSESTFLRCHTLLLSERRSLTSPGQRPARCLLRRNQVLRAGRDGYQQVQVRTQLFACQRFRVIQLLEIKVVA